MFLVFFDTVMILFSNICRSRHSAGEFMELRNNKCNVKITVDATYTVGSTDNQSYDIEFNLPRIRRSDFYKVFSITIDLFYRQFRVALAGSYYSYEEDCAILDDEILTILQNDTITQLNVIDGSVLLFKKFDCFGCNMGIYRVPQGYLIYGEIEITMLDFEFNKKWQFSGKDIFVSISGKTAFQLCEKSVKLYDFEDNFYEIDFNGQLIREN